MPTFVKPGTYIQDGPGNTPTISPVKTAIPVFIGFTSRINGKDKQSLVNIPTRINSIKEFKAIFGKTRNPEISINLKQIRSGESGAIQETKITVLGSLKERNRLPKELLFYCMQIYFGNGGETCYIVSIGKDRDVVDPDLFINAFSVLEKLEEPTLLVFPDACLLDDIDYAHVVNGALEHCHRMKNRFAIIDIRNAVSGGTASSKDVTDNFRNKITSDTEKLSFGGAYFPYLKTRLKKPLNPGKVYVKRHKIITLYPDNDLKTREIGLFQGKKLTWRDSDGKGLLEKDPETYKKIKSILSGVYINMPPSAAVAGAYARVDSSQGVWKAPANVNLNLVMNPTIRVNKITNNELNIDKYSGKSVNSIRSFVGKGTLIWGARTLSGNSNEFRYISVRRFYNFISESIRISIADFAFYPNDFNTWIKIRSMIEFFLTNQWRSGALQGHKPEETFYVRVGLNQTMTDQDITDGRIIVEIGLSITRPAEFIGLRIVQNMAKS